MIAPVSKINVSTVTSNTHRRGKLVKHLRRELLTEKDLRLLPRVLCRRGYRQRHKIDELAQLSARKVFNDNLHAQSTYNKMLPHGLLGRDYGGRPILYKHCGHANFSQLDKAGADLATALRYNEWLTEQLAWRGAARGGAPPEGTALAPGRPLAGLPSSVLPSTGLSSTASPGNGEPSCKEQMEDEGSEFEGDLWI